MSQSPIVEAQALTERRRKSLDRSYDLHAHAARLEPVFKILQTFRPRLSMMMLDDQFLIREKVERIADIEPVLDFLSTQLGIEFDKTFDQANYGWREFKSAAAPWLRVDAELVGDGPECRRVIVGYETVPKYELRCGEDAAVPDATPPSATTGDSDENTPF